MAAMDKKRVAAQLEDAPAKRRFRAEALDLFLAGDISGQRTQKLLNSAKLAGAQHVDDLAGNEANSNASRDLLRKALKASLWPKPYIASVPAFCTKTGNEKQVDVAMFLPHEMIAALLRVNEGMDTLRLLPLGAAPCAGKGSPVPETGCWAICWPATDILPSNEFHLLLKMGSVR